MSLKIQPSPLQAIDLPLLHKHGVKLYIKRDDLLHPHVQGNKWRKLKYNLLRAQEQGYTRLLTFGGPYSNHIYAVAAAASAYGLESVGIIRSYSPALTPTLEFAQQNGMQLHFVDASTYQRKTTEEFQRTLQQQYGEAYIVPEGGSNNLALQGVQEMVREITIDFNYIVTACGTGGTLAGIVSAIRKQQHAIGISALKGDDLLSDAVNTWVKNVTGNISDNFEINFNFHQGGYARTNTTLNEFILQFYNNTGIKLEPVYTGKMMMSLLDLVKLGRFAPGSVIVAVHTGGLQGLCGYPSLSGSMP